MSELSDKTIINRLHIHDNSNYEVPNDDLNNSNIDEQLSECNLDIHNTNTIIAQYKKVNASTLKDENPPNSLRGHNILFPDDKHIWDRAYDELYCSLHHTIKTWNYISETKYKSLIPTLAKEIPIFSISIVKKNEEGKPIHAKHRTIVLRNLDLTSV